MRRRGFLGMLAGGAIAGPGMAKQAAAQALSDLSLPGVMSGANVGYGVPAGGGNWAVERMAELVGMTVADHAKRRKELQIMALDPDIAALGSVSLVAKIGIQRIRTYERNLESERSWLEREVARFVS